MRVNILHNLHKSFFLGKEKVMHLLIFILGAMFGGTITLFLHCCLILGRESDKQWEEEQISKKEKNTKN